MKHGHGREVIVANLQIRVKGENKVKTKNFIHKYSYGKQACNKGFLQTENSTDTGAVKCKRLRRAYGALDSAGSLCLSGIKEGFASLCSRERLLSLATGIQAPHPTDSCIVSPWHNRYAGTWPHQQPYTHKNVFLRLVFYP